MAHAVVPHVTDHRDPDSELVLVPYRHDRVVGVSVCPNATVAVRVEGESVSHSAREEGPVASGEHRRGRHQPVVAHPALRLQVGQDVGGDRRRVVASEVVAYHPVADAADGRRPLPLVWPDPSGPSVSRRRPS